MGGQGVLPPILGHLPYLLSGGSPVCAMGAVRTERVEKAKKSASGKVTLVSQALWGHRTP